jgi:hypothetical protein
MVRVGLEHPPHLLARARGLTCLNVSPGKIDARIREPGLHEHNSLEYLDGRRGPVLMEERDAEQMQTVDLARGESLDLAQLPLGRRRPSRAQSAACRRAGALNIDRIGLLHEFPYRRGAHVSCAA